MATRDGTKDEANAGMVAEPMPGYEKDNTMAMFIMAGMVVSSAGFAMYTRQADSLLKRMGRASKIQGLGNSASYKVANPKSKLVSKKSLETNNKRKTFHEKDDIF